MSATSPRPGPAQTSATSLSTAILIPAFDEETNIVRVVEAARQADLGTVLVVDDGSSDATAAVARGAGARVLRMESNRGKGAALARGAAALDADVVVLVDADLTGLAPDHLHDLADPVRRGEVDMTRGVFMGGRWRTAAAQQLIPQLNGQRALRRTALLDVPDLAGSGYGVEIAITDHAVRAGWRCRDVPLLGVSQVMKEEKRGLWRGLRIRLRMYREVLATWIQGRRTRDRTP